MATAIKHKERSKRSNNNKIDFSDFERKASAKKYHKERKNFIKTMFSKKENK